VIQRCQKHKRENTLKYLDKIHQSNFHRKLQLAYEQLTYEREKKLNLIKKLKILNQSAVLSLEETLTLHLLGIFSKLGISFKTNNYIEKIMIQMGFTRIG
jgi:hypothetical protein